MAIASHSGATNAINTEDQKEIEFYDHLMLTSADSENSAQSRAKALAQFFIPLIIRITSRLASKIVLTQAVRTTFQIFASLFIVQSVHI
jgi:hypothetical protein